LIPISRVVERAIEAASRIHAGSLLEFTATSDARLIHVDRNIMYVITNLLDNAIRACGAGEPVRIVLTREDESLVIAVIDQGVGLQRSTGGDPFRLGYTTRRHDGGTGTGLAYARDIVEAAGGAITLEDNSPRGARAEVRLPLKIGARA
jgi:signal transduction histidine kinase